MKTAQYLDAAKKKLGIESDYALSKRLGLTTQAISKIRLRPLVMSNTTAAKVAEILEVDPLKVIADCELERGGDLIHDEIWARIARRVAVLTVAAIGAGLVSPPPANAAGAGSQADKPRLCIMLNRPRRWWNVIPSLCAL